jgi:hypothetical protein
MRKADREASTKWPIGLCGAMRASAVSRQGDEIVTRKPLAVEIVWSQLLLCGGEWKTRKQIYEELLAEGFERRYVDWYLFCLSNHQPKGKTMEPENLQPATEAEPIDPDIEKRFTYHPPKGNQLIRYERLRDAAKSFAYLIKQSTPYSREQSLALTHLEDVVYCANAAIARNE